MAASDVAVMKVITTVACSIGKHGMCPSRVYDQLDGGSRVCIGTCGCYCHNDKGGSR